MKKIGIGFCLFVAFWAASGAKAALQFYSVTLADNRPARASSILVEFTTTQAIPPSSTITGFFPTEWTVDSTTPATTAMTVSINGVSQTIAPQPNSGSFGATVTGQQAVLTTPTDTTIAAGTSLAILYGSSGTWYTPSNAGVYPLSTSVKNSGGETIENGASYVAIAAGVEVGAGATPLLYAPSSSGADSVVDTGTDASEAVDAPASEVEGEGEVEVAPEAAPEAAEAEAALEATPPVDLGGDEGVDAVDVAEMVLLMDVLGAEAVADFNGDGAVSISDLGVVLSAWTGTVTSTPAFDRFDVGPPLTEDVVIFGMQLMNTMRASVVQTQDRETLALTVSTGETPINIVDVYFDFDVEAFQVKEIYLNESIVSLWAMEPEVVDGTIHFIGAIPGGFSGSGAPLVLIEFAGAISNFEEIVAFSPKTGAVYDDGIGTLATVIFIEPEPAADIAEDKTTLPVPPSPDTPLIDSGTHPDPYQWYADASPSFFWDALDGDMGYAYILDHELTTMPEAIVQTKDASVTFVGLEDGEWMFHLRRLCESCDESTNSRRLVRVDTTPPEPFDLQTGSATFLWEEFPFLVFETTDAMSGLAYYEVEANGERTIVSQGPFVLSFEDDGWYRVSVTAVDRAGNRTVSETTVQISSASSFFIATDGLVRFLLVVLGLILGLLAFVVWRRRTNL